MADTVAEPPSADLGQRITIYRAADGKHIMEAMEFAPMDDAQMQGLMKGVEAGSEEGNVVKVLFSNKVLNLSLTYAWFKKGFPLPRHSHSADCLYYVISGELQYGSEVLKAGDGMFVPAGALYTFESVGENGVEFVEFRQAAKYDINYKTPAKIWDRQTEQVKSNREAWAGAEPPLAARRMLGEASS